MDDDEQPRRKRLSAEARRRLIIDAARDVFLENGEAGARLRDIADRAGITEAYLYRYFTSKAELYHAAVLEPVERIIDDFEAELDELVASNGITAAELVRRLNEIMLEFMVAAVPYLGVALFSDLAVENSFYKTTLRPRVYDRTRDVIAAIKGWPDRRVDLGVVNDSMWSLNYGVALDGLLRGVEVDVARAAKRVTQLYVLGIPQFKSAPAAGPARRGRAGNR
ncbi:MAG: TetR/AcrR family transcriptional regulator [Actinomycetota bacterium]